MMAEKLLLAFCLRCQLVILVSTPKSRFSTSFTASSVGTLMMSMLIIRFWLTSDSLFISSSLM